MDGNTINTLLLKTAFCCMACDGEIAPEEIELIKSIYPRGSRKKSVIFLAIEPL